jgi:hypothetical protein
MDAAHSSAQAPGGTQARATVVSSSVSILIDLVLVVAGVEMKLIILCEPRSRELRRAAYSPFPDTATAKNNGGSDVNPPFCNSMREGEVGVGGWGGGLGR